MPQHYHFKTTWHINAPLPAVWNAIYDIQTWPAWWPGLQQVSMTAKGNDEWDNQYRLTWKSALPYTLSFSLRMTGLKIHEELSGEATGELQGKGTWHFATNGATTTLTYYWDVATTKTWMNLFSFLLKPAFRINHDMLMKKGEKGLKRMLETSPKPLRRRGDVA